MKDEGKTVMVRFISPITSKPLYVRVKKTVPMLTYCGKNQAGEDVQTRMGVYGAQGGALWVNMMEKAFAVVRSRIDPASPDFRKSAFGLDQ